MVVEHKYLWVGWLAIHSAAKALPRCIVLHCECFELVDHDPVSPHVVYSGHDEKTGRARDSSETEELLAV